MAVSKKEVLQRLIIRHGKGYAKHGQDFVKHVAPAVIRPARTLWNEVIGFIFLCFGVIFGIRSVRLAMDMANAPPEEGAGSLIRLLMAAFCTLVMLWFGLTSFLKARKISRS